MRMFKLKNTLWAMADHTLLAGLMVCVLLTVGCGENSEVKLEQAKIAMANHKPEQAIGLIDGVLADQPDNFDALLIQAQAQVELKRLGPARLTLKRLAEKHPGDARIAASYMDWAIATLNKALASPAFDDDPAEQQAYDRAMQIAQSQIKVLRDKDVAGIDYLQALLSQAELKHASLMVAYAQRMVGAYGPDAKPVASDLDQPDEPQSDEQADTTYGRMLAAQKQAQADAMEAMLSELEAVLASNPKQVEAATLFLRTAAEEKQWARLLDQVRRFAEVKDLPVPTAAHSVNIILGVPDEVMPLQDRIALGRSILQATPTDQSDSQDRQITSARLLLADGKTDKALPILAKLVDGGTEDAGAFVLYSHALYEAGDFAKCREVVERMLAVMPEVSEVQALYGMTLWQLGEYDKALGALREACRLDPTNKQAANAFAGLMVQQGLADASGDDIEAFYQMDTSNPLAIRLMLQHAAAGGDTQRVSDMISQLSAKDQHTPDEMRLLYSANIMLKNYTAAEDWARRLTGAQPDDRDAWMLLAAAQLQQDDETGMQATFRQIMQRFPDETSEERLTGELYRRTQQFEKSVAILEMALEKSPEDSGLRLDLARSLASMGRYASALEQVDKVLDTQPNDLQALALAGQIEQTSGDEDKARDYLSRIDPKQVDSEANPALAARVQLSRGDLDTAQQICSQAIAAGNTSPVLRLVLTQVYEEQDQPDRAEEQLETLVRQYPNSTEVYAWLASFYERQGQVDQGIQKLKALEIYNPTQAILAQADLFTSAERYDDAIKTLDPLLDRLVNKRDRMAQTVAKKMADLYEKTGRSAEADRVYDRLYKPQTEQVSGLLGGVIKTWDTDTPARRLSNLDSAAVRVSADDIPSLIELARRYAMLGRYEQSLSVVQRGLSQSPKSVQLLSVKAGILAVSGRSDDAVNAYRAAMDLAPNDKTLRVRYARALSADGKHPEAEDQLMLLIREGGDAALQARTALLEMYMQLGLTLRAVSIVDAVLDKTPAGQNDALDLVIGRVLLVNDRYLEAQQRLVAIPDTSPYYPAARIEQARSLAADGNVQAAESQLIDLVSDPAFTQRVLPILSQLDPKDAGNRTLLTGVDQAVHVDDLPYQLALRWLQMRMRLCDESMQWDRAKQTLDAIRKLDPDQAGTGLRVVLLYRAGDSASAAKLLKQSPALQGSVTGSLLAFALDSPVPQAGRVHPMTSILSALSEGDPAALASALSQGSGFRTLFPDDMRAACGDNQPADGAQKKTYRDLAMATVAVEAGMPKLAASLCDRALDRTPNNLPALAVKSAMWIESQHDLADLTKQVASAAPDSSLTLLLSALSDQANGDMTAALPPLRSLADRQTGNAFVAYRLAQALNANGDQQEAIGAYRKLIDSPGPYQVPAENDLAYLLAKQGGASLDDAITLGRKVLKTMPGNPAVLDTVGWIEHLRDRDQDALGLLAHAIVALHDVPEAHYHLGVVYHVLGKDRWARFHLQQAASGQDDQPGVAEARQLLNQVQEVNVLP